MSERENDYDHFKISSDIRQNMEPNIILCVCNNVNDNLNEVQNGSKICSERAYLPVYTAKIGYKVVRWIHFYKDKIIMGLSLRIGQYDDMLKWQFSSQIEMKLINQVNESNSRVTIFTPDRNNTVWNRPTNDNSPGEGGTIEISHEELTNNGQNHSEFLRNDTLYFQFKLLPAEFSHHTTTEATPSRKEESKESPMKSSVNVGEFLSPSYFNDKLNNFYIMQVSGIDEELDKIDADMEYHFTKLLTSFYTNRFGHHLQCKLIIAGDYVSVAVGLISGTFDEILTWPFDKKLQIILINQVHFDQHKICNLTPQPVGKLPASSEETTWLRCRETNCRPIKLLSIYDVRNHQGFLRNNRILIKIRVFD